MNRGAAARMMAITCLAVVATGVGGCSRTGDFGRQKPSFVTDQVMPGVRSVVHHVRGLRTSRFELTPDESELRALSRRLKQPLAAEGRPGKIGVFLDDVGVRDNDFQHKRRIAHDTGTAAYKAHGRARRPVTLLSLVETDNKVLRRFSRVAERVYRSDGVRRRELARGLDRSSDDIFDATRRIKENRRVVAGTMVALRNRIDDYRIHLRRGMLQRPHRAKTRVAVAIDRLESNTHRLRVMLRRGTQYRTAAPMPIRLGKPYSGR